MMAGVRAPRVIGPLAGLANLTHSNHHSKQIDAKVLAVFARGESMLTISVPGRGGAKNRLSISGQRVLANFVQNFRGIGPISQFFGRKTQNHCLAIDGSVAHMPRGGRTAEQRDGLHSST